MHRHIASAQKARVDVSIRTAAKAKYGRVGPYTDSVETAIVPVIIEVPKDQRNKLEYDKDTDTLQLDRVLHSSCHYPGDYGFVPRTLCPDGDPIDVLVLSKFALTPGVVADCRIVGVMDMEDEKGGDAKLIAVVASEPRTMGITDIHNVPAHVKAEIQQFFELYKSLEAKPGKPKWVKIRSWGDRARAMEELGASIKMYEETKTAAGAGAEQPLPAVGNVYELTPELMDSGGSVVGAGECCAYIEVQKGDANKYEWDKQTGFLTLDRVLHSAVFYPGDYGFIPRTLCGDGDPIDVLVLSSFKVNCGVLCDVRVIGALNMSDEKGEDQKLIAVIRSDPRWDEVGDLCDVEDHIKREIQHFFETYKELENKVHPTPGSTPVVVPVAGPAVPAVPGLAAAYPGSPKMGPKKRKWATIKGWYDRAGAIELLKQAYANYEPSPSGLGNFARMRRLNIGDLSPQVVNAMVRAPKGTNIKHTVLSKVGLLKLDKVLHSAVVYPGDLCSIPQTLAEDGQAVECLCLSVFPLPLGCVVQLRVVAMLSVEDQWGPNMKVIGVPDEEPRLSEYKDLDSIPIHVQKEVSEFFNTYKNLEGEDIWAQVTGWSDRAAAMARIEDCRKRWFSLGLRIEGIEEKEKELESRLRHVEDKEQRVEERLARVESALKKHAK